ncbi:MAG: ankyrin repeat domain-containing protein [Candidatus Zixiibacteriota bacterium]
MRIFGKRPDPQAARHLVFSAMDGANQFVAKLLSDGVHVDSTWSGDGLEEGVTALMMAAWKGHATTVSLLLEKGADVRAKTRKGSTVLDYAVIRASSTIVTTLLAAGARPDASKALWGAAFGSCNPPHDTAYSTIIKLLLAAGGDPNYTKDDGSTPLMVAATNGHIEAVRLLLSVGASRSARNRQGKRAIDLAKSQERSDVVALLSRGA